MKCLFSFNQFNLTCFYGFIRTYNLIYLIIIKRNTEQFTLDKELHFTMILQIKAIREHSTIKTQILICALVISS
jgi:hypothetical protein